MHARCHFRPIRPAACAALTAALLLTAVQPAAAQLGWVLSHQKISDTQGGFTGLLNDLDTFGSSVAALGDLNGNDAGHAQGCAGRRTGCRDCPSIPDHRPGHAVPPDVSRRCAAARDDACALPGRRMAAERQGGAAVPDTEALATAGGPAAGPARASASSRRLSALVQRPQTARGAWCLDSRRCDGESSAAGTEDVPTARRLGAGHHREAAVCPRRSVLVRAGDRVPDQATRCGVSQEAVR